MSDIAGSVRRGSLGVPAAAILLLAVCGAAAPIAFDSDGLTYKSALAGRHGDGPGRGGGRGGGNGGNGGGTAGGAGAGGGGGGNADGGGDAGGGDSGGGDAGGGDSGNGEGDAGGGDRGTGGSRGNHGTGRSPAAGSEGDDRGHARRTIRPGAPDDFIEGIEAYLYGRRDGRAADPGIELPDGSADRRPEVIERLDPDFLDEVNEALEGGGGKSIASQPVR